MTDSTSNPANSSTPSAPPKTYPCPRCGTQTAWQDNKYKPFCSSRCKLIDLGAWANEEYTLPAETTPFSDEL
uniref:DNA gyrase inhibitor YacG n=1 Tax=uncultured Psychrobacter sp. TaxID=259303 RepID=UPI0025943B89|nr:DNA gyrase inhibitor YacG [uncultured Psychrobacter sp.]